MAIDISAFKTELSAAYKTAMLNNGSPSDSVAQNAADELANETAPVIAKYIEEGILGITVDSELDANSTNPVENKVITAVITAIQNNLSEEIARATAAELANAAAIVAERLRAEQSETANASAISEEASARASADSALQTSLSSEVARAEDAETANAAAIAAETLARQEADDLKENKSNKDAANGYCPLDSNKKVPLSNIPDSVLGQLEYQGAWDASSGSMPTATEKGQYWVASSDGTGDTSAYKLGDWAVYNGSSFDKIDNTDAVSSVNGQTGAVVLNKEDIGLGNVSNVSTNNQTPTWTIASALTALASGETLTVAFGKIAKAVTSLISHIANTSNPHSVTAPQIGAQPTVGTSSSTDAVSDTTTIATGFTSPNIVLRTALLFWTYVQSKISSVLGLTATSYTGTAAKATADASGNTITETYSTLNRIDLTGTTTNVDDLDNSVIKYDRHFVCRTAGGAANITGIPIANVPFNLDVISERWGSASDFHTMQIFTCYAKTTRIYVRWGNGVNNWQAWKYYNTEDSIQITESQVTDLQGDLETLQINIDAETSRATAAELANTAAIAAETSRAQGVEANKADLVNGVIPSSQLPSFVDDVLDAYIVGSTLYASDWLSLTEGGSALTPESGKIYIVLTSGDYQYREYRWSGTTYAEISKSLALGETESSAYRGDRGAIAYNFSQETTGVTAGTYGSATQVPQVTLDAKGRATGASNVAIQITESQVTGLPADLAAKQATVGTSTSTDAVSDLTTIATGFTSPNIVLRTALLFWTYIQSKISSVLGLTATNYGGTATKATADASGNTITETYSTLNRIDLTGTTTNVDDLDNSVIKYDRHFVCRTAGGAANITGIPIANIPFNLDVISERWGSASDFHTMQIFTCYAKVTKIYVRWGNGVNNWQAWKYYNTEDSIQITESQVTGLPADLAAKQPLAASLTAMSAVEAYVSNSIEFETAISNAAIKCIHVTTAFTEKLTEGTLIWDCSGTKIIDGESILFSSSHTLSDAPSYSINAKLNGSLTAGGKYIFRNDVKVSGYFTVHYGYIYFDGGASSTTISASTIYGIASDDSGRQYITFSDVGYLQSWPDNGLYESIYYCGQLGQERYYSYIDRITYSTSSSINPAPNRRLVFDPSAAGTTTYTLLWDPTSDNTASAMYGKHCYIEFVVGCGESVYLVYPDMDGISRTIYIGEASSSGSKNGSCVVEQRGNGYVVNLLGFYYS